MNRIVAGVLLSGIVSFGCSDFGNPCTSNADCRGGVGNLVCLPRSEGTTADGGCTTGASFCTLPCSTNADCSSLGTNFTCNNPGSCAGQCVERPKV